MNSEEQLPSLPLGKSCSGWMMRRRGGGRSLLPLGRRSSFWAQLRPILLPVLVVVVVAVAGRGLRPFLYFCAQGRFVVPLWWVGCSALVWQHSVWRVWVSHLEAGIGCAGGGIHFSGDGGDIGSGVVMPLSELQPRFWGVRQIAGQACHLGG